MRSPKRRAPKTVSLDSAEQAVAEFLEEEAKLSSTENTNATRKTTQSPERKNREAAHDLPPIIRNPEMRRRRVKLTEAVREIGLDEAAVAETLMEILVRRRKSPPNNSPDIASDKFLLDVVKESVRILDGAKSEANETAEVVPTILRLTHHIPRPVRGE
jgi:hypothetical protein